MNSVKPPNGGDHGSKSVVIIGCGMMGATLANAISAGDASRAVIAVDPNLQRARRLIQQEQKIRLVDDLGKLQGEAPAVIILAVEPALICSIVKQLPNDWVDPTLISVAAGIKTGTLRALLPESARLVRAMPNLAVAVHEAMIVAYNPPENALSTGEAQLVEEILEEVGKFEWVVDERFVDIATAVSGSGPAYFFALVQALEVAAKNSGLPDELATTLSRQVCIGAGRMLAEDARDAGALLRAVSSPGGTTEAGMNVLNDGLDELIDATVLAAYNRALSLGS